jgi:hypothetical protein
MQLTHRFCFCFLFLFFNSPYLWTAVKECEGAVQKSIGLVETGGFTGHFCILYDMLNSTVIIHTLGAFEARGDSAQAAIKVLGQEKLLNAVDICQVIGNLPFIFSGWFCPDVFKFYRCRSSKRVCLRP